jgi:hypothetical protein
LVETRYRSSVWPDFIGEMTRVGTNQGVSRQKLANCGDLELSLAVRTIIRLVRAFVCERRRTALMRACAISDRQPGAIYWRTFLDRLVDSDLRKPDRARRSISTRWGRSSEQPDTLRLCTP